MTQQEFYTYVSINPTQLNVWYSDTNSPYTIYGLSIPVIDKTGEDSKTYLSQVEEVTIPLSGGSVNRIALKVRQSIYGQSLGAKYYILLTDPVIISNIGSPLLNTSKILLSPTIDVANFADSPYNVLEGYVNASRQSKYIMKSDRYKVGTLRNPAYTGPLNINYLLSGSATKANIQDSNYSNTAWIRSRYDGSSTSILDYKIEPALTGRVFEGAQFGTGSDINQINYLLSSSQVAYKDLFYAGKGDTPGFDISTDIAYKYVQATNPGISPVYIGYTKTDVNPTYTPKIGDLIVNKSGNDTELMKITKVVRFTNQLPITYSLDVIRSYYSPTIPVSENSNVSLARPVQIYNLEANKLSGVPKGLILVRETGKLLGIDSLGYVVSST